MDQVDVLLMQNWEHVLHVLDHLHLLPRDSHGVDFSRVRHWTLNGWSRLYRQTLAFSAIGLAELNSVFSKHCANYAGRLVVQRAPCPGTISNVVTSLSQKFYRIPASDPLGALEARFEFFKRKILPRYSGELMKQTLVFVSSYFEFLRLRAHLSKEEVSFAELCEYTPSKEVSRSRDKLFHGKVQFVLYTERFHFFRRSVIFPSPSLYC